MESLVFPQKRIRLSQHDLLAPTLPVPSHIVPWKVLGLPFLQAASQVLRALWPLESKK